MISIKSGKLDFGRIEGKLRKLVDVDLVERQQILVEALEPVSEAMKANVPRLTGASAESIRTVVEKPVDNAARVSVGAGQWTGRRWVGLGLLFTEYGFTSPAGKIVPARPVMRNTWYAFADRVRAYIAERMAQRVQGAAA